MKKYILSSIILLLAAVNTAWGQNVAKNTTTGVEYASLKAAVEAADPGATIELIADDNVSLTDGSEIEINKSLTITGATAANGEPLYTIYGKSTVTGYNDIFINGSGTVTLSNLKIKNFGNDANTDPAHAPVYVSTNFTGNVTLDNVYVSDFNRGGIFLYGGEFLVKDCFIDCANSRSGAFTKGIEIWGSAYGTIKSTVIQNMECSSIDYSVAGIEVYGNGSITVDDCIITSDADSHSTTKGTYGIVSQRVGVHDPSGGTLRVKGTLISTTQGALTVADNDEYGPTNDYTIIVEGCSCDEFIAVFSESSQINIKSGEYDGQLYAGPGTIVVDGGEFSNPLPYTDGTATIIINGGTFETITPDSEVDNTKKIIISGGTFETPVPNEYCADGYSPKDNGDGTYGVISDYEAKIGSTKYATLGEAISAAQAGETITLLKDITLTNTVAISKGITIDGGGNYTLTSSADIALMVTGTGDVTLKDLNVNATNGFGVRVNNAYAKTFTIENSTITVATRGVDIYDVATGFAFNVTGSTIQSNVADPTTTYTTGQNSRGISFSNDPVAYNATVTNTTIQGFSYDINLWNGIENLNFTMNGGATYGRAAINNHGKNNTFTLNGVEIHGLNNQTGPTEAFACIVDDTDAANNTYYISNCTITSIISAAASSASGSNASQYLVDLRGSGSTANITNGTTYSTNNTDRGGLIEHYSNLDTHLGNTINFDAATYQTFDAVYDFANVPCLNTTGNTLTYTGEVFYYRSTQSGYQGTYCTFAEPFVSGDLDNGEFIQLQRDVTLTDDVTWQKGDGNSFYLELNGHSLSRDANALVPTYIYLNEGVTVYTDAVIDGLLFGLNDCGIAKQDNTDATYIYKYTATDAVAQIGNTIYQTLTDAINAAHDDDTILLLSDIGSYDADPNPTYTTEAMSTVDNRFNYWINKSITIDGGDNNYSIYVKGRGFGIQGSSANSKIDVTFQNVIVSNVGDANGRCIDTRGNLNSLTLDNVCLTTNESSYTGYLQPLTIGGNQSSPAIVTITNSGITTVDEANKGYAITTFNPVNMTITDSEIRGWACLNIKGADSSAGSAGSTITVEDCFLASTNNYSGATNEFSLIKIEDDNVNVSITGSVIDVNGNENTQSIVSFQKLDQTAADDSHVSLGAGNEVTLQGDYLFQDSEGTTSGLEVSGGKFNVRVPMNVIADGLICPTDANTTSDFDDTVPMWKLEQGEYVAKIGDYGYETLEAAIDKAEAGQTIELLTDIDLSTSSSPYVVINKAVTIDGGTNQYEIKGTGSDHGTDTEATIVLQGTGNITLKNLKVTNSSTNNNGVGIKGTTYAGKLTIDNCVITVPMRGVNVEDIASGFSMDITNSTIQSNIDAPTTTYVDNVDSRGISFSDADELATAVTITDTKIQGFKYDIYVGENKKNLTLTMNGVEAYGLNMLNLNGANNTVNLNASQNGATTFSACTNGGLVTDEDAYGASTNIIYLDEATKTAQTNNVLDAVTALTTVSAGTGKYKLVSATAAVAQIGETKYETLEAAFAAVQNGETITMLKDVTLAAPMDVALGTKAVTLDLGGNTLSGRTNLKNGELTIKNGTVAGGNQQALNVYGSDTAGATNYSVLNINSDVTVTADQFGVCMFGPTYNSKPGYGAVINIAGTVHTTGNGAEGAVFVSGNLGNNIDGDMNNVINITGSITSDTDAAIALNGNATVNVQDGAAITGNTAIAIKRGTLNVEGGTVHATGLNNIPTPGNNNGTEMTGAAVSMSNTYNQYGGMQVNITGGSFTSDHAMALYKEEDTYQNDAKYSVSGGIFNTPVQEEFCAEGYVPTSITTQGFTQYTVAPGDFVAQIGETKYTTLAAAVAAVPTNGTETTITLLKDITLYNNVVVGGTFDGTNNSNATKTTAITNQNVKLDLNGHNITGTKTLYLAGGSLNITGTGSITSNSVDVAPVGVRYVKTDNYPDLDYTSKRTLTIGSDVTLTGAQYGLNIFGTNEPTTANNIDVTVDGKVNGMLFVLGNLSNANNNIVINVSGTVDASHATGSEKVKTGIALCGNASVHIIDGAVVKGESGIEVRAGELIMDGDVGGTITATSADYSYTTNGSGTTVKGAAIAVAQHGTKIATSATILGGTLTGTKKIAVIDAQTNSLAGVTVIAADGYLGNSATETVLPDGYYWLTNGDETSSPASNSAVAQIGNTLYSTLAAAVAAVPTDGTPTTITLLQNISLTDNVVVGGTYGGTNNSDAKTTTAITNQNVTLDLNSHNITGTKTLYLAGGSLNITGTGIIESTSQDVAPVGVRYVKSATSTSGLDYTSKRTLTIGENVTLTGAQYGLNIFGTNEASTANNIDVTVDGTVNGMLFLLGNISNANNNININVNGTVDASAATGSENVKTGIALNGNAKVTVADGATVKGESGIEVRAGKLTVNGGTIEATAASYSYAANGSGTTTKGAAIAVAQHGTVRPIDVTINGGTLTGAKKIGVTDVNNNYLTDVSVVASNSFVANEADTEIPAGFLWVDNGNNTKKLVLAPARIGDTGYATLAEAVAAVQDGQTIKLFADITLTDDISTNTSFTLDFNSHNVIRNGNHVVLAEGVSILTNVAASQLFAAEGDNVVVESNSGNTDYPYEYSVKKSIANAGITISVNSATYTGEVQTPTVTVKDGNNVLVAGTHYTISYKGSELKNANTYVEEIIITGIGDYAGTKTADFTINKRNINDVTVEGHSQTYTTSGYTTSQIEGLIKLKYNDIPLVVSTDYTIAVDDTKTYKDSGTYPEVITLTAVPGGNFEGSRKVNFYIGGAKDITTSNIIATVVYNGSAQVPSEATVTVKDGNTNQPLTLGTDFTLEYFQNYEYINAQTYVNAITIVGIGTYYGTKTVDYIITPKDISGCIINNSTTFTGAVIDPATVVTVKDGNTTLSSTDDYTLTVSQGHTYQNPQTYGNAITITGKGNYTGTKTMDFIITQTDAINLATAAVVISKQTYTGADLKPTAATTTVTVNGAALDPANYTFSFVPEGDNFYKDAKVYSNAIIITASTTQSTYYGTVVGNYIIEPRDLSDNGITVTATDLDYNADAQNVTVTVKYGNNTIPAANYTFEPTKVTEAGQYTVTVTAVENSNLVGTTSTTLLVKKALDGTYASDFTVSPDPIPTQTETGNEIKPVIVVKDKDRVMTSGVDYTVAYTNNINAGTATITITGTGAYSGTKTINFTIVTAYFTENGITYHHANEGEEVSVGNSGKTLAVDINTTGNPVTVPQTVTHDNKTYTVTGVEQNAFSSDAITGIVLPQTIADVENGAFNGANNLRYVDLSTATGFTPSSLQRNIAASPFNGVPKQALVFLNGTTFTGENYVYNPGSGNQYYCEVFKIYDDLSGAQTGFGGDDYKWAFENPHPFTAYSIENTRQLTAERHYTICLPYALEIPNNVKAYTLEATSNKLFGFTEVTGTLAAYTPYVLIPTKSGQLLGTNNNTVIPAFQPATDADATKLNGQAASNFTMYGTMRYMEGADAQGKYIMQYNNGNPTWKQITETNAGFNASNKACILPMRAYIMSNTSGSREFFDVVFTNIDGTTLTFDKVTFDDDTIYDLSGRRVELLEHGHTYIINGKKVIAK